MNGKFDLFSNILDVFHGIENYHDMNVGEHEIRTGKLMSLLGKAYGFDETTCGLLNEFGTIHDIGKIIIPEKILEKPGPLTLFERRVVELHPIIGHDLIKRIKHPNAELAGIIILTHHEHYDGSGYPKGLKGTQIPIEGCICTICDVYDALRARRSYRKKLSHSDVFNRMYDNTKEGLYQKFHPGLMKIFKEISEDFQFIYEK